MLGAEHPDEVPLARPHRPQRELLVLAVPRAEQVAANTGWTARIIGGLPEFIPPAWIDPTQTPRRKPRPPMRT